MELPSQENEAIRLIIGRLRDIKRKKIRGAKQYIDPTELTISEI